MILDFDFREVVEFRDRIEALAESDIDNFIKLATRELAGELMRLAVDKTPRKTGRLVGGWRMTRVKKISDGYEVRVVNPVEYALYVEKGHLTRNREKFIDGVLFLEKSEIELQNNYKSLIESKLRRFLEERLNA